ncbi:MAG TPA: hypothetical protein VGQ76_28135 [Thermoanaerobaculia bacterium]|jgi:hypothetical protein|nr:hypothetical protein [Thermoanaerobaculia bacterium]
MSLSLLLAALCTFGISLESKGSHVMVATLEQSTHSEDRPTIGIDDVNRLGVNARVDEIRKGTLPFAPGSHVALGVHSIAKTFGGDYAGEQYEIGLEPRDDGGYRIMSIVPLSESRLLIRGTVTSATKAARRIDLGETRVPVRVESVLYGSGQVQAGEEIDFHLRLREGDPPKPDTPICIFALYRPERADKPFRLMRLVY